jgi:hypothetical protein
MRNFLQAAALAAGFLVPATAQACDWITSKINPPQSHDIHEGQFNRFATMRAIIRKLASIMSIILGFTMPLASQAAIGDTVTTDKKVISEIVIQNTSTSSFYYAKTASGWGITACPNVLYVYIDRSTPGADAVLSAILTARSTGKPIGFSGICGDTNGDGQYIQIRAVYF